MKTEKLLLLLSTSAVVASLLPLGGCTWFSDPPSSSQKPAAAATAAPGASANAAGVVNNAAGQPLFVVKADFTPLYRTGPAQPTGPDQSLPKDTLVAMLKRGFGFSRVQLEGGLNGYVATEDLAPASAERVAPPAPVASTNTENNSAIVEHYTVEKAQQSADISTSNAEAAPDLPEPRLEPEPTPVVKPDFRY